MGRDQIELFDASRTSEALRYTAGVTSDVFGDDQDYDWLRVRGFQADQTGIYLDNAQNLAFAFGSFFIDPYTLERIEVLRGPASALYGGSNPGGIVNYVSKRPGTDGGEIVLGINDAVGGWAAFDYGQTFDDGQAFRVYGRLEGGEKYDDLNEGWRGTLGGSYFVELDTGTQLTLILNLHKAEEKHNGSTFLPYFGTVRSTTEFGFIDPDANFSDSDWDNYSRDQGTASVIVEHQFDNEFVLTGIGRVGYAKVDESYYFPFGYGTFGFSPTPVDAVGTLDLIAFEHDTEVRTGQMDVRYFGTVETGPVEHDLLFGLDARAYWLDETQASAFANNTVVNPTAPGTPTLNPPFQDAVTTQNAVGLYVQDQLRFGDGWIATLSGRQDWVFTEQDGAAAFSRNDSEFSYRASLAYQTDFGLTPYATYSTFFNPLLVSPANGVTEPERGDQIEAGLKFTPDGGNALLTASIFQINRENVVTGAFPNFDQLGLVEMQGAEVEGSYDFGNGLRLRGAATFLDATVKEDSNAALIGNTPTQIPEYQLSALVEYAFQDNAVEGLSVGAGVRHTGESYADAANTLSVPSSTIFDGYLAYDFLDGFRAQLSVTNIADDRYVTGCQTVFVCSYGSGREIALTLKKSF
ncbi:MAG: TonB-dependent siderophore receptor [Pseudomonadota bacterium]